MRQCETCRYWEPLRRVQGVVSGHCRRYAPRPGKSAYWSTTLEKDWCGEYEETPDESD